MPEDFDYKRYLASREWALKKRQVRERSGGQCERCIVGKYQDTHHITYERIGSEELSDLLGVCRPCHAYMSGTSDVDPAEDLEILGVVRWSEEHPEPFHPVFVTGELRELFDAHEGELPFSYVSQMGMVLAQHKEPFCSLCVASTLWKGKG